MDLGIQRVEEAFCMFHDGKIDQFHFENNRLNLRIRIRYLAEMVDPCFYDFYVTLNHCYCVWLKPWSIGLPPLTDMHMLSTFTYDILEARSYNGMVEVSCTINDPDDLYRGGELMLDVTTIQVYDEVFNRISVDDLKSFSKRYWSQSLA